MDENQIREAIFAVLKGIAPELDPAAIEPDRPLRDQVDLDSMDFLNFILGLHKKLGVNIPEADYRKLFTLEDITAYLRGRLC
ncbi:MAG TPA: acyl carrier protein [Burkholderiales bacterium]|nr:acyl carrier protein [Burkholderiales bacterium]